MRIGIPPGFSVISLKVPKIAYRLLSRSSLRGWKTMLYLLCKDLNSPTRVAKEPKKFIEQMSGFAENVCMKFYLIYFQKIPQKPLQRM